MKRQHAISQAKSTVADSEVLERLFGELAETFKERNGGYTRIIRDGHREGDNADMAYILLVLEALEPKAVEEAEEVQDAGASEEGEEPSQAEDAE
jgi:large subunit ribosomal protein L17